MRRKGTVLALIGAVGLLTACGDPLSDVPKLSEVELADGAPVAELATADARNDAPVAQPGLVSRMIGGGTAQEQDMQDRASDAAPVRTDGETDTVPDPETPQQTDRKKTGLFGLFRAAPTQASRPVEDDSDRRQAALPPPAATAKDTPRRGLFGAGGGANAAPPSVPAGTLLSFGLAKPVCDLPPRKRGKQTGAFPERGKTWRLYDSAPGKTTPHPFYVTGFDDGCARTFTAAVAVFGAPAMHELLRYGLPAEVQPYSATDKEYERIKSRICRVGRGKPCGARIAKLEKNTVFVSAYEKYGNNARWFNMLLHDGELVATDLKGGG